MCESIYKKKAVALKYDREKGKSENESPVVVARGRGRTAERIMELARENDVFIHEDGDLVELLAKVNPGEQIPEELYEAVAKVLAIVYEYNKKYKKK